MPLKTLFLNPPSLRISTEVQAPVGRYREIESYWYPVWLAYPAGMLEGARLLDAPPHHVTAEETIRIAQDYELLVLFTSTPGFKGDVTIANAIKDANPKIKIAFVGPHVSVLPDKSLNEAKVIDVICRKEFDYSIVEYAQGKPLEEILGISYRKNGQVVHNPDRPPSRISTRFRTSPTSIAATSMSAATTFRSCCIRSSRFTPLADAPPSAPSASGRKRSAVIPGASVPPTM